ncbi:hypothetical protein FRC08_006880 [Ceratobasidium sp. 394]|nr:hypothetical protein FRC08_006880 [Ceratobasidium sp. 394]KAG9100103.1 hypothetical protein FS749_016293 [Ceratobasidium sp. UAMH 11750]
MPVPKVESSILRACPQGQLSLLQQRAAQLAAAVESRPQDEPDFRTMKDLRPPLDEREYRWDRRTWHLEEGDVCQRTLNSWALQDVETGRMVIPAFAPRDDVNDDKVYRIFGWASPLNDGSRRASRAISGFTPVYKPRTNPKVWQMKTTLLTALVKTPYMGEISFFGCRVPCVIFRSATFGDVEYGVQNPDPNFRPYWEATRAIWAVEHALGTAEELREWHNVDLAGPRPWYMNKWATAALRLEYALPPDHPDDPERPAMLGRCRHAGPLAQRRAPTTEVEWAAISPSLCEPVDDEEGHSDAVSVDDDADLA